MSSQKYFRVENMDCASEEAEIRRAIDTVPGVRWLSFQLSARTMGIDADAATIEMTLAAMRKLGFKPQPVVEQPETSNASAQPNASISNIGKLVTALCLAIGAEAIGYFAPDDMAWKAAGFGVAASAIWFAGFDVYKKGWAALVRGRLNISALMTVAVTGAFIIGQWPEGAMVMALYAIAEAIEARAVDRARNSIKTLLAMAPEEASVKDAAGQWRAVPVANVAVGTIVRIRPGERVPMDGKIIVGTTSINQAPVTGESLPVEKKEGDMVFAGTINENGAIEVEVTALASNSTLARIIHAVEEAQGRRAPTQGFVDKFAQIYTPSVFAIAVFIALTGPWLLEWTWLQAIYKALVLLVIACPCALVISTPVTIVSGLATAARRGILIKGGIHLENTRKLKVIALDKTGTITEGKPKLVHWEALEVNSMDAARVKVVAASLSGQSDHPVSRAIAGGLVAETSTVSEFKALAGRGVQAKIDGVNYVLGNHRLIEERGQCSTALEAELKKHESQGRTVTLLASSAQALGFFAVADTIKDSSREAVASLRTLGVMPVMLTGDNQLTATAIASVANISEARGNLLPQDKLDAIKSFQKRHGMTAMVGDGINDAPALAQADLGIAMGGAGTDTAMEAADIVIMNDDLRRIPEVIRLSQRTHAILWQNISLALGIKFVFLVLAVFGSASMWMAVFADMGASLLVVANGLRLLRVVV